MKSWTSLLLLSILMNAVVLAHAQSQERYDFAHNAEGEESYTPVYDFEYIPDFTYDIVEERVNSMDTEMSFELNETIFSFINYFTVRNREYSRMSLERKEIYFPLFEAALERHEMPTDIKYLAIVESGLNPKAKSRVGAMGLWQFMPATGRIYNLHVTQDIDDRMDPELATEAACKYLKSLYRMFGDWELALAAYNCGPGNVRKAIRRSGGKNSFWEIYQYLPRETRGYIPQFQAIMYVFKHADDHNLILEEANFPVPHEKVQFDQEVNLKQLASLTGICLEDLEFLNPAILRQRIPHSQKHYALRVPQKQAEFLAQNKEWIADSLQIRTERLLASQKAAHENSSQQTPEKTIYRVRRGDALGTIARSHNISISDLKAWNGLHSNLIKIGQPLIIYRDNLAFNQHNNSSPQAKQDVTAISQSSKTYIVQPGDSLWLIARKLEGVSIEQIKKMNNLNNNKIKPGQKLIIG